MKVILKADIKGVGKGEKSVAAECFNCYLCYPNPENPCPAMVF
jgi:hypothetical protein